MGEYIALGTPILNSIAVISILMLVTFWFLFEKAQQPGWIVFIPVYNALVFQKIAGKSWWWIFGFLSILIPIVGLITFLVWYILLCYHLSKRFLKNAWFTLGLVILFFVFFPILAFGQSAYTYPTKNG